MTSGLCWIIALSYAMSKADPGGGSEALGWLIEILTYADDFVLIDGTAQSATDRITAIAKGLREVADMDVSVEKTECLFVKHQEKIRTDDLFEAGNAKAQNEVLTHKCEACSRGFSTHQGLKTHEKIWCGWADRLDSEEYEVNRFLEARGSPEHRFYLVSWKGHPNSENSWILALWAEGAQKLVDQFWNNRGLCQETAGIPEAPWTDGEGKQKLARCFWCCRFYAREQDLKGHLTKGCKCKPGSRTGSASEKALIKEKIKGLQKDVGKVYCEEHLLKNVYHFCYLGADFQVDGDHRQAAIIRLGMAKTVFGKMMHIWKSDLALPIKMELYQAAIVTVLAHGSESWCFDTKLCSTLRGWNSRCLVHITGNHWSDECRHPTFDLIACLKKRRLKNIREELWLLADGEDRWTANGILCTAERMLEAGGYPKGFVLEDAPTHNCVEDLMNISPDEWDAALSVFTQPFIFKTDKKAGTEEVFTPTIIPEWKLEICRVGGKFGRYMVLLR